MRSEEIIENLDDGQRADLFDASVPNTYEPKIKFRSSTEIDGHTSIFIRALPTSMHLVRVPATTAAETVVLR